MISDGVSLADKVGTLVRTFVAEERTFDTGLTVASVLGPPPNKGSVSIS